MLLVGKRLIFIFFSRGFILINFYKTKKEKKNSLEIFTASFFVREKILVFYSFLFLFQVSRRPVLLNCQFYNYIRTHTHTHTDTFEILSCLQSLSPLCYKQFNNLKYSPK